MPVFLVHIYILKNKIKKILEKFAFKGYYLFIVFFICLLWAVKVLFTNDISCYNYYNYVNLYGVQPFIIYTV